MRRGGYKRQNPKTISGQHPKISLRMREQSLIITMILIHSLLRSTRSFNPLVRQFQPSISSSMASRHKLVGPASFPLLNQFALYSTNDTTNDTTPPSRSPEEINEIKRQREARKVRKLNKHRPHTLNPHPQSTQSHTTNPLNPSS